MTNEELQALFITCQTCGVQRVEFHLDGSVRSVEFVTLDDDEDTATDTLPPEDDQQGDPAYNDALTRMALGAPRNGAGNA